MNVPKANS